MFKWFVVQLGAGERGRAGPRPNCSPGERVFSSGPGTNAPLTRHPPTRRPRRREGAPLLCARSWAARRAPRRLAVQLSRQVQVRRLRGHPAPAGLAGPRSLGQPPVLRGTAPRILSGSFLGPSAWPELAPAGAELCPKVLAGGNRD